jgi:Holliday junction resolvase
MSGRHSRNKGARTERAIVRFLQDHGVAAEKVSGLYKPGPDLSVPVLGVDRRVEVKARSHGFAQLYSWLIDRDLLIVKSDRAEPLVILRLGLATEIAIAAEKGKGHG